MLVKKTQPIMDVCFVIDATNSMQEVIHAAHDKAQKIAHDLKSSHPKVDFKFATVCYRDPVDSRTDKHQWMDFDGDIDNLVEFYSKIVAHGGGDLPEDWVGAFFIALHKLSWRNGAKSMIWITDMNAHGRKFCGFYNHQNQENPLCKLVNEAATNQIVYFGLSIDNGADRTFEEIMKMYKLIGFDKFSYQAFSPAAQIDASVDHIEEEEDIHEEERKEEPIMNQEADAKESAPETLDIDKNKKKKPRKRLIKKSKTRESLNIGNYFRTATLRACDLALLGCYGESDYQDDFIPSPTLSKSNSAANITSKDGTDDELNVQERGINLSILSTESKGDNKKGAVIDNESIESQPIAENDNDEEIVLTDIRERDVILAEQNRNESIATKNEEADKDNIEEKNVEKLVDSITIEKPEMKNNCCNYLLLILSLIAALYVMMYRSSIKRTTIEMDPMDVGQI